MKWIKITTDIFDDEKILMIESMPSADSIIVIWWTNDKYPWAHYSADGWMYDEDGRLGILEIKTTEIKQASQLSQWQNRIPDNYYIQVLHGMLVMEADFAVLKAQLKTEFDGIPYLQTKHYPITRAEVAQDLEILADSEWNFAEYLKGDTPPALILPEI